MNDLTSNPRAAYFDSIARQWDGWEDLHHLAVRLAAGLEEFAVDPGEIVLDIGCGTGNLTKALLARLSPAGRVVAVDISPRMIEIARHKTDDPRVQWHVASAQRLPLDDCTVDRVICFSVWPHLHDHEAAAMEFRRVLRYPGELHVWHIASRQQINQIHEGAGGPVRCDLLPPARETAALLDRAGFQVTSSVDDAQSYLVTAMRKG